MVNCQAIFIFGNKNEMTDFMVEKWKEFSQDAIQVYQ